MKQQWWHDKVVYQIYPKSFCDTTGSGIGDLNGITKHLDYLQDLGVDIIWLSPCYPSPMADQGYDISDYRNIHPDFGTLEDFDRLVAEAKARNIGIIMDLVANHCSDEHPWFQAAMKDPYGEYGKYFYLEEGMDGGAPNNWRSYFGGSAWEKVPATDNLYYLHMFHKKQPDLNWENPKVRREIYDLVNFWFDRGVVGFRIDAITDIKKPKTLRGRNYPPDREDGMVFCKRMLQDAHGIGEFLTELKEECFLPHQAFTVGEVSGQREEETADYVGVDGYFSSMFDFEVVSEESKDGGEWYKKKFITPSMYRRAMERTQKRMEPIGLISTVLENHDVPRIVNRMLRDEDRCDAAKKALAVLYLFQKGIPFIYQGQEIGMENTYNPDVFSMQDVSSHGEYRAAIDAGVSEADAVAIVNRYSRDNARTPFQWDDSPQAGFTTGTPWLAVNPNYKTINAAAEVGREDSVYAFYKAAIALRKDATYHDTMVYGRFDPIACADESVIAYARVDGNRRIVVVCNLQSKTTSIPIYGSKVLLNNYDHLQREADSMELLPFQAVVLKD
ncbi:MAG: alpha-glucosidase [Lachnospiraceae bacterium]|nr:alpha-glucosidase [Lachnospiraceae bacterium]